MIYFIAFILFNFPLHSAPIEVKKRFFTSPCVYDGLHQESLIGLQVHFLFSSVTHINLHAPLCTCTVLSS